MTRSSLTAVAFGVGAFVAAVVACRSNDDPGFPSNGTSSGGGTSSGSSSSTSSGGIDAAIPDGPVDCGPAPGAAAPFTKQALLGAAADCAAWHACSFQNAATALRTSVRAHAAAPTDETKTATQAAWKTAMNEWSIIEGFQFGPIAPIVTDKYHGRSLRSFVHPWPDHNRCQVENQVLNRTYESGWQAVLPNSRGLFGLEYLLFYPGVDTACLPASATGSAWATTPAEQLTKSKNDYAVALADNLVALSLEIRNVWAPEGEDFKTKLLSYEKYGSEQETLNVLAWALFYAESEIKDDKLAGRAGVSASPPISETPFAGVEVENMRTNLRAFRDLFQGCSADGTGVGFDDWLVAVGQATLAQNILAALADAQSAADAFPPFAEATQAQFLEMYNAIKPLSDLLKTSMFGSASPLNLKLPATAASDTD